MNPKTPFIIIFILEKATLNQFKTEINVEAYPRNQKKYAFFSEIIAKIGESLL